MASSTTSLKKPETECAGRIVMLLPIIAKRFRPPWQFRNRSFSSVEVLSGSRRPSRVLIGGAVVTEWCQPAFLSDSWARVRQACAGPAPGLRSPPTVGTRVRRVPAIDRSRRASMANIRPLHDRVIVKRVKEEEKSKGGIIIPDTAKEKPIEGEVLAVGNGKVLEDGTVRKLDVKVGDRVLFGKYGGTEVKVDGEDRLILREDDILGVLEK